MAELRFYQLEKSGLLVVATQTTGATSTPKTTTITTTAALAGCKENKAELKKD